MAGAFLLNSEAYKWRIWSERKKKDSSFWAWKNKMEKSENSCTKQRKSKFKENKEKTQITKDRNSWFVLTSILNIFGIPFKFLTERVKIINIYSKYIIKKKIIL